MTFTAEPITRTPVNEQAARNAAAGPSVGIVRPIGLTARIGQPPIVHVERPLRFTVDQAYAVLDASAGGGYRAGKPHSEVPT